jgi:hypothetical protein
MRGEDGQPAVHRPHRDRSHSSGHNPRSFKRAAVDPRRSPGARARIDRTLSTVGIERERTPRDSQRRKKGADQGKSLLGNNAVGIRRWSGGRQDKRAVELGEGAVPARRPLASSPQRCRYRAAMSVSGTASCSAFHTHRDQVH